MASLRRTGTRSAFVSPSLTTQLIRRQNFILIDEICRSGSGGIVYGLAGGFGISLPTVLHFGSDELRARIVPECLKGTKRICLAITEVSGDGQPCARR